MLCSGLWVDVDPPLYCGSSPNWAPTATTAAPCHDTPRVYIPPARKIVSFPDPNPRPRLPAAVMVWDTGPFCTGNRGKGLYLHILLSYHSHHFHCSDPEREFLSLPEAAYFLILPRSGLLSLWQIWHTIIIRWVQKLSFSVRVDPRKELLFCGHPRCGQTGLQRLGHEISE